LGEETFRQLEEALADGMEHYTFRLYVTGATPRCGRAISNLKAMCERYLRGRYDLEVIDVYQQPLRAEGDHILVTPTLVRREPLPLRRLVGDLSDRESVLVKLDLVPHP
jgi:circadian clock protein KaiB